jgi:hypothetical protein
VQPISVADISELEGSATYLVSAVARLEVAARTGSTLDIHLFSSFLGKASDVFSSRLVQGMDFVSKPYGPVSVNKEKRLKDLIFYTVRNAKDYNTGITLQNLDVAREVLRVMIVYVLPEIGAILEAYKDEYRSKVHPVVSTGFPAPWDPIAAHQKVLASLDDLRLASAHIESVVERIEDIVKGLQRPGGS